MVPYSKSHATDNHASQLSAGKGSKPDAWLQEAQKRCASQSRGHTCSASYELCRFCSLQNCMMILMTLHRIPTERRSCHCAPCRCGARKPSMALKAVQRRNVCHSWSCRAAAARCHRWMKCTLPTQTSFVPMTSMQGTRTAPNKALLQSTGHALCGLNFQGFAHCCGTCLIDLLACLLQLQLWRPAVQPETCALLLHFKQAWARMTGLLLISACKLHPGNRRSHSP